MTLHPQAAAFLKGIAENPAPGWEDLSVAEARKRFDEFAPIFGDAPELQRVEDYQTPGGVSVRLYSDEDADAQRASHPPVVMYFHGGGWVLGSVQTHDALCRRLAKASGCTVISVDYRCSPESPFPGPVNDCYEATQFVANNSASLKVDAGKMAVAGDSAGGQLAAAVSLKTLQENGPAITMQVLLYPITDRNLETESYKEFAQGFGLTRANMEWFWEQFTGDDELNDLATPLNAKTLEGLPRTHVVTAGYDVLRDEGVAFAQRLETEGVDVSHKQYVGMLHGFIHFAGLFETGVEACEEIGTLIRDCLVA